MKDRFKKANGFPTSYGYACGYGREARRGENYKNISEDPSHRCLDVRSNIGGHFVWKQFFYSDGPGAARKAEAYYSSIKL